VSLDAIMKISLIYKIAARLERSSFCRSKAEAKKREWKTEIAAQNIITTDYLKK